MPDTATQVRDAGSEVDWYRLPVGEVCQRLDVSPETGLTATEVEVRRQSYGPNELAEDRSAV
jgi:magnesium-transporting ATPase (P-type)